MAVGSLVSCVALGSAFVLRAGVFGEVTDLQKYSPRWLSGYTTLSF